MRPEIEKVVNYLKKVREMKQTPYELRNKIERAIEHARNPFYQAEWCTCNELFDVLEEIDPKFKQGRDHRFPGDFRRGLREVGDIIDGR